MRSSAIHHDLYTEEINYPIVSLIHPTSNIRTGSQNWVSRVEVVCLYSHVKKVPNGKFIDPNLSLIHSISTSGNKTQNWLPVLNWRRWIVWLFCFWQQKKEWMKEKRKNNSKVSLEILNFGYFSSSVFGVNLMIRCRCANVYDVTVNERVIHWVTYFFRNTVDY